jgi:hypothetical protein
MHPQLTATCWEGIPGEHSDNWVLLFPVACVSAWRALANDTGYLVLQARTAQEAARRAAGGMPPMWAIAAMVILGFDEFMWLLRSPFTLLLLGFLFLFGKALYVQMDVEATVAALGLVPSLAVLGARLVPSAVAVLQKLIEAGAAQQAGQQAVPLTQGSGGGGGGEASQRGANKKDD